MPMNPLPVTDADVNAYVDGQLAPLRTPAVEEAHRARSRACRAGRGTAQAERRVARCVRSVARRSDAAAAAWPPRRGDPARGRGPRWLGAAVAAAASLVVGLGVGWFGRDAMLQREGTPTSFTRQAALVHALYANDENRPVEIWAAEEQRLVRWLSRRLGFQVRAPDSNSLGFALVGGRLVAGNENPTALFVYENQDKQRLTLQVRKPTSPQHETAFRYAIEDGVGVYYWIEENCTYALSGNLDRAQLLAIGRVVYGQLAAIEAAPK